MMPRRPFVRAVSTLLALLVLGSVAVAPSPAHADEKKQVYVKPSDMAAATAAREKGVAARKLLKEGKHAEGVKMLDEAVGELERTTGPDSDFSRANRDVVVSVYKALKQPDKAEAALKRAEAARRTWKAPVSEPANANTASAMKKMEAGLIALKANDFPKAAQLLEQAMPDLAKSDVGGQTYLLIAGVLASLYDYSQQFTKGEALRKDVIAKMEKSLGEDHLDVAEQYQSLATHYIMRLETPKAILAQKKAVDITRRKAPGSTLLGDRLLQLANLQVETGSYDVAQPTISEAMLVVRGQSPVDPLRLVRIAELMVTLADAELKFKEGDQAADMTCKIAQSSGKAEVLEEAEEPCIRAAIARGDTKAAGELAGARFARIEKRYGKSGPFFAHAAHELAIVRWVEGRKDEATSLAKRGADAQEAHLVRLLNASGDSQKRAQIGMLTVQQNDLLTMGGAGIDGGTPQVRLALETILRRKGRSLDASADAARLVRLFKGSTERGLATRQVEVRRQIAALGLRGGGGGGGGGLVDPVALLARLEAEDDDISNKLAAASPLYRAQSRPVTIEAVQATIPDDAALLEYVFYQPRDTSSARFAPKGINFVAFVLHKTGEPQVVDLGSALPIDASVEELRKALSTRGDVLPNAKRVHDLVFAPLRKHLRPTDTRLIVSPDEDLNLVPYAALVDDRGRFLVQDFDISYVTSGRDLLRIAALGSQTAASSKPVVLGNPSFDIAGTGTGAADAMKTGTTTATRGDLDNARFPALPGTAVEVKAIADMLTASAFTADDATKSKLAGVTSPIVLHVATHGFFLAKQKDPAGANTRALEYDPGSTVTVPQRTENPLVRSGLALAGANRKGSADGLLTALEASSMSLDGTRLVVLSACETGVGQSEVGDGVYGLRRALVVAGSETQVMSLWKVDDDATRDLMIAYYKDLKGGAGRSAALRKVQLGMLSSTTTQHPYFWAAFIPSGAWGPMGFALDAPTATRESTSSPVAKDRPSESRSYDDGYKRKGSAGFVALGAHYATLTNLRDQPDRTGIMAGFTLEHSLLGEHLAKQNGLALHDAVNLAVYAGARTSDGTKYVDAEEGEFAAALRAGYEMALGVRGTAFSLYGGMQALYTSLIIGDARSFGMTLPLVGLFDFRVGKTFVGLRGTYGKFIVDQETVGGSLSINWDDVFLLGGIEQLKMPATVSLDGKEDRTTAGNQVSTIGTVALGGRF